MVCSLRFADGSTGSVGSVGSTGSVVEVEAELSPVPVSAGSVDVSPSDGVGVSSCAYIGSVDSSAVG